MPQNIDTGRAANEFGHDIPRRIAVILGAISLSSRTNEFSYNERRVAIKCARYHTTSIGVTYLMLERIEGIIGAFQEDQHNYDLYLLNVGAFRNNMRDSQGSRATGQVGLVARWIFKEQGQYLGHITI